MADIKTTRWGQERTFQLFAELVNKKVSLAIEYGAQASIYEQEKTLKELTTAQTLVLSTLYGLLTNDIGFLYHIAELSASVEQFNSSFIKIWLRDDFSFNRYDIVKVMKQTAGLMDRGWMELPSNIFQILSGLVEKYDLMEYFTTSGNSNALNLVMVLQHSSQISSFKRPLSNSNSGGSSKSNLLLESNHVIDFNQIQGIDLNLKGCSESDLQSSSTDTIITQSHDEKQGSDEEKIELSADAAFKIDVVQSGDSLLHTVVPTETVTALLKSGENPNLRNNETSLKMAVEENNLSIIEELIQNGADIEQRTASGYTLLHEAASRGYTEVVRTLLKYGAARDVINLDGKTPLFMAIEGNHPAAIEVLTECGANVNVFSGDKTPLHFAATTGNLIAVKTLIELGADCNLRSHYGFTPLHFAINGSVVKKLIDAGGDPNATSNVRETPLHFAASKGYIEAAQELINSNAIVDFPNNYEETPLYLASITGEKDTVKLLIESGSDADYKDKHQRTFLHRAANNNLIICARLLMEVGADKNARDYKGWVSIHIAASRNYDEMVKMFLNEGVDVNVATTKKKKTSLHIAAYYGCFETAKLLLNMGADPNLKDIFGYTALQHAKILNRTKVAEVIKSKSIS